MAKFVIECPNENCGKYIQVSNSIFSRRRNKCSCGREINIKTDRMMSRECACCGNTVVFDAKKRDKAKCPVCKNLINTTQELGRVEEFSCAQCGVRLRADKSAARFTCPVCDFDNDVQAQLTKERAVRDGVVSHIKYEGDNQTFIWKHPIEDFNMGSQVTVHETQEAIFFRDGRALDTLGPGRHTLETQSIPIMNKLYQLPTHPQQAFHAEVYFVNMVTHMGIKWGTPERISVKVPDYGFYVQVGAGGEFSLRVLDSRRLLLKLVGTAKELTTAHLMSDQEAAGYFRALIISEVKTLLPQIIRQEKIDLLEADRLYKPLSEGLRLSINRSLAEYGLEMPEFYVTRLVTPEPGEDPNFDLFRQQYADRALKVRQAQIETEVLEAERNRRRLEAQTEAEMKILAAQAEAEAKRQQILVEAEEMRVKGYTYQQETGRMVGLSASENMGSLGGGLGEIAGLGVALGAMGTIADTTREAVGGMTLPGTQPTVQGNWKCSCGVENTGKFCMECGAPKPQENKTWKCSCGVENTGKFCMECGAPKPQENKTWKCSCGVENIGKFCMECGAPKPDAGWNCTCGKTGIIGKFCPECGKAKEV